MAVKFEFIVDDADAENIMSCINDKMLDLRVAILDEMAAGNNKAFIAAVEKSINYYKELELKMLNSRVLE